MIAQRGVRVGGARTNIGEAATHRLRANHHKNGRRLNDFQSSAIYPLTTGD
jgi:hypothetical protein